MRKISERTTGRTNGALNRSSRIAGLIRDLGAMLFLVLLPHPALALPSAYTVTLAWGASPSPEVTGYRIYYGVASGAYTSSVVAGNVTTNTVSGLSSGVTYFFAATAFNASGQESPFSNEISFVPGPRVQIRVMPGGRAVLTVKGLIGHAYDIQVTSDLKTWTVIGAVTVGASGSVNFTNSNVGSFSRRYYRARDTQP